MAVVQPPDSDIIETALRLQLSNRLLRMLLELASDKEKPETAVPLFWLPRGIAIRQLALEAPPASSGLDHLLEFRKALEGHRDGELHSPLLKLGNHLIAEKGAVHTHLSDDAGTGSADTVYTVPHELKGAIGTVDIARTGKHIKDLRRLGDRTKQRNARTVSCRLRKND